MKNIFKLFTLITFYTVTLVSLYYLIINAISHLPIRKYISIDNNVDFPF